MAYLFVDEHFDLRPWRSKHHRVQSSTMPTLVSMRLRHRSRPPPIGCAEWPAGRVLLQLLIDDKELGLLRGVPSTSGAAPATVLEVGAGIGTTAVGLALVAQALADAYSYGSSAQGADGRAPPLRLVATDTCEESLANLRANAASNGLEAPALQAALWDAAGGTAALASCPIPPIEITHLIGADVVYHGGADGVGADECGRGLAATLAALLRAQPEATATLLLVDRFSGGAISAVAMQAGVEHPSCTVDPALVAFQQHCRQHDLDVSWAPLPDSVVRSISATQAPWTRAAWWLACTWEGLQVYTIRSNSRRGDGTVVESRERMNSRQE